MEKRCVFCGERPEGKTKEHVIPIWLIELAGDRNRTITWGLDLRKGGEQMEPRKLAFDQLTCPACRECNNKFSGLETEAKRIVGRILREEALSVWDLHSLLDWFDKVRIGLWLGHYYMDANRRGIRPKFPIASRMGAQDRMLGVYYADYDRKGITVAGSSTAAFSLMPSCFSLLVNHVYFTSMSTNFLISRRIGFPYPVRWYNRMEDDFSVCDLDSGLQRTILPLLRNPLRLQGTELYQPLYPLQLLDPSVRQLYHTEYVQSHSLDCEAGIGMIFREADGELARVPEEPNLEWTPRSRLKRKQINRGIAMQTLEQQIHLFDQAPTLDPRLPREDKRHLRQRMGLAKGMNRVLIAKLQKVS